MNQPAVHFPFPADWQASVLTGPPLIAPARQVTWPQRVAGEEDALARGALLLDVRVPATADRVAIRFLATCARGYRDPAALTGVWSTPDPSTLLAVAGGYAYRVDARRPDAPEFLPLRPVLSLLAAPAHGLLLLAGSYTVLAIGAAGMVWESERLSDEGLAMEDLDGDHLRGKGWNMRTDRDRPFRLDLANGKHAGT